MGKAYSRVVVVKQPAVRQVLIYSFSDTLVAEVVVKFVPKRVFCVVLHHHRGKLFPFPYNVISEEKFCAVKMDFLTA